MLPHNFNELCDASVAILKGKKTDIMPDFITSGMADFSNYNDGLRGGKVRVRAKISTPPSRCSPERRRRGGAFFAAHPDGRRRPVYPRRVEGLGRKPRPGWPKSQAPDCGLSGPRESCAAM